MASEILYCARCHRVILPREIADGAYHFVDGDPVCRECFTRLSRRLRPMTGSRAESKTQPIPIDLADLEKELSKGTDGTQIFTPVAVKEKPASKTRLQGYRSYREPQMIFMGACFLLGLVLGAVAYFVIPLDRASHDRNPRGNGRAGSINGTANPADPEPRKTLVRKAPEGGYLISAAADATVTSTIEENHGTDVLLTLTCDRKGPTSEVYLRFDLSSIRKPVKRAEVDLAVVLVQSGGGVKQEALLVTEEEKKWNENVIIWATRPPAGKVLYSWSLPAGDSTRADVTAALQEALAENRRDLSLCLRLTGSAAEESKVIYSSINNLDGNGPVLLVWPGEGELVRKDPEEKSDPVEKPPEEEPDPGEVAVPEEHKLAVTVEGQGTVELDPPGGSYRADTLVTLKAIPEKGALFAGWGDAPDPKDKENPRQLTVRGRLEVIARFKPVPPPEPVETRLELNPVADTYTYTDAKGENNGTEPALRVSNYGKDVIRRAYLRFDLSKVKGSVETAQLSLFAFKQTGTGPGSKHAIALIGDNSWKEYKLTAGAAPKSGKAIGTWEPVQGKAVTIDVIKQVKAALAAGKKQLSLEVSAPHGGSGNRTVYYGSRESKNKEHRPVLVVTSLVKPGERPEPPKK